MNTVIRYEACGIVLHSCNLLLFYYTLNNFIYTGENPACERRYHHSQSYLELCVEFCEGMLSVLTFQSFTSLL